MNGYKLLLVSAVGQRDGMAIELATEAGERIAEVFEDDVTRERTITFFTEKPVPLSVIEWLLREAASRL
jgi:predicted regulator of amino acid metabolism with ACT domain